MGEEPLSAVFNLPPGSKFCDGTRASGRAGLAHAGRGHSHGVAGPSALRKLCESLKDPQRNGNRTGAGLVQHAADDHIVNWGLAPWRRAYSPADFA